MLALMVSGLFWAYLPRKYPSRMSTPLSWVLPESLASRSMLMTPARPMEVWAVIREGFPKAYSPMS
ncbi:MAG: hypothetical protein A4E67_01322 [Syntrophaceae bacterium PtaB.Bin038]|nr:MAG: hypothetical protein A4E67_01322 [Syntrophaceae bacterium PtaB.Bin038]